VPTDARTAAPARGRVLDPVERLSEILFGLIMAMTFTGSVSAAGGDEGEIRLLLVGAIGCNIAWGLVDAVMYVFTTQVERARRNQRLRALKAARDPSEADRIMTEEFDETAAAQLSSEELAALRAWAARLPDPPERPRIEPRTLRGAVGVFLLVALSTFPLVVPFLLVSEPLVALRVSHGIGLAMLFGIGAALGHYSGQSPFRTGVVMLGTGVVLVLLTIFLGG
jgi:hypothetical protein